MASPGSFIRSAARVTFSAYRSATRVSFSAYRRVPVRWRLGGGSAALTFVILAIFGVGVGVLTDRQINSEFNDSLSTNVDKLKADLDLVPINRKGDLNCNNGIPDLADFASPEGAQIRVIDLDGTVRCTQLNVAGVNVPKKKLKKQPDLGSPPVTLTGAVSQQPYLVDGFRAEARAITWKQYPPTRTPPASSSKPKSGKAKSTPKPKPVVDPTVQGYVIYARPVSSVGQSVSKIRVWLSLGVLGGAVLALLAGLLVADRAMRPISELTDVAREIERTRNPTLSIPIPTAEDELSELARTLEGMLGALDDARNEAVSALARQREFVADASHELRTPLTSVLANLELLADELDGEPADSAKSALMATRRMRRLVGDLLLLARADVERNKTLTTVDLAETVTNVAVELGPVAEDHVLEISPEPAPLMGLNDDLHRLVLNLVENAIHHTPAGTRIHAASRMDGNQPVLVVEDNGGGISPDLQGRVFERFVRGGGDSGSSRGTGLGLSIVSAVAGAHGASVTLKSLPELHGTRFEIRFPPQDGTEAGDSAPGRPEPAASAVQTSTTTGRTIGRRRNRS
jgi:two-component system, OmpR family, sensor kinase